MSGKINSFAMGNSVVVLGSLNADLAIRVKELPKSGETVMGSAVTVSPGGKSGNEAVAAALAGASTAMIGAVGNDEYADILLDSLNKVGVDTTYVCRCHGKSGSAVITVSEVGENTIVVSPGANALLDREMVYAAEPVITSAKVLGLCLEVPDNVSIAAAQIARKSGVFVVFNPSPLREFDQLLLELADLVILNEYEAEKIGDLSEKNRIVTKGASGSTIYVFGEEILISSYKVNTVDTTGAGDAFMGAIMSGIAAEQDLVTAAKLASAFAALSTTKPGAQSSYPSLVQALELLE